jgi:hypothetical protein
VNDRLWRSMTRSTLDRDEADLVGDDVVHLAGELGAFPGEHGLGDELLFMLPGLVDLGEAQLQIASGRCRVISSIA